MQQPNRGRNLALEAGTACHDFFAAVRLWQLWRHQNREKHFEFHGRRIFGQSRHDTMLAEIRPGEDDETNGLNYCLAALNTAGYYDDPNDKRRTLSNLETACYAYYRRWDWNRAPVWIANFNDPTAPVGIEISFDTVITFHENTGAVLYRFVGRIDGIHLNSSGQPYIHENKTASRLDTAWRDSFHMSSQITGYAHVGALFTGSPISEADILGLAIPQPKSTDNGFIREWVTRQPFMFADWYNWFWCTTRIIETYKDHVLDAPKYTHSCNRYFSVCQFLSICASDHEEAVQALKELEYVPWSPLDKQGEQM